MHTPCLLHANTFSHESPEKQGAQEHCPVDWSQAPCPLHALSTVHPSPLQHGLHTTAALAWMVAAATRAKHTTVAWRIVTCKNEQKSSTRLLAACAACAGPSRSASIQFLEKVTFQAAPCSSAAYIDCRAHPSKLLAHSSRDMPASHHEGPSSDGIKSTRATDTVTACRAIESRKLRPKSSLGLAAAGVMSTSM